MTRDLRVLFVEDSEDDTLLLVRALRRGGFQVRHRRVEDAAALSAALEAEDWDLVLSDYRMPRLTGLESLRLVRARAPDLPFILVSGAIGEDLAVDAMKRGAHDYVLKDNLARLAPAVARELEEAAGRRQRRQAEAALRESEARLRLALHAACMDAFDYTHADNCLRRIGRLCGLLDLPPEGAGGDYLRRVHPEDRPELRARLEGVSPEAPHYAAEYRLRTPDGGYRWVADAAEARFDESGRITGLHGVSTDITARKEAEEALRSSHDLLEARVAERTVALEAINRALREEIEQRRLAEAALQEKTAELEARSASLAEANTALRVLLDRRAADRRELEEKVLCNIDELIRPNLAKLAATPLGRKEAVLLEVIDANLRDIASPLARRMSLELARLSVGETQVANLIRQGRTTKEIAALLGLAPSTIDAYRNSIRRKLGLRHQGINLKSYLASLT
jgi:PAS domain S-box-containing protein